MKLNKNLFYIHRFITVIYIITSLIIAISLIEDRINGIKVNTVMLGMLLITLVVGYIQFKISNEVSKGSKKGKWLSRIIGILLLFGAPLGTALGIAIIILADRKHWETKPKEGKETAVI